MQINLSASIFYKLDELLPVCGVHIPFNMKKLRNKVKNLFPAGIIVLVFISLKGYSQPDYSFAGSTLLSGTDLDVGAVYLFPTVRPGVDARMTITDISPGIGLTELDGASGYAAALQPTITAEPWTTGYVEMTIRFVTAGTNTDLNQPQIALTSIDVDGSTDYDDEDNNLYEYDMVNMGGGYYDMNTAGGELSVTQSGNWFTGKNIAGIDYPGRDTASQQVMFSVINANVTSLIVRVGVINQTANSASRLRSIYFKKFVYQNSILALNEGPTRLKSVKNNKNPGASTFSIYPTVVQGNASIFVEAVKDGWASFELVDYSGRILVKQQLIVDKGSNRIPFMGVSKVSNGNYIAVLKMDGEVYNSKFMKQ